jgi:hypothetical protein
MPELEINSQNTKLTASDRDDTIDDDAHVVDDDPYSLRLVSRISRSFTQMVHSFHKSALGDDDTVQDRWEDADDDNGVIHLQDNFVTACAENLDGKNILCAQNENQIVVLPTAASTTIVHVMGGANKIMPILEVMTVEAKMTPSRAMSDCVSQQPTYNRSGSSFGSFAESLKMFHQEKKETRTLLW